MLPEASIEITARPAWNGSQVASMRIRYVLRKFSRSAGDILMRINAETVTIPFCPMSALAACDETGPLSLVEETEVIYPVTRKSWTIDRPTHGEIIISYTVMPRKVPAGYRSSPYFDFRSEPGGANGAGITFLAEITGLDHCCMHFEWDLSHMPADSRGVSSLGEGSFSATGKPDLVVDAFYAVGQLKSITDGDFGFFWFSEPGFDIAEMAGWTRELFRRMSAFFDDQNGNYRIFMRKDPFEISGGGTALPRSYLFGYSEAMTPTLDSLKNVLAHEMAHNYVHLQDEPYGIGTWFTEGMTEYYSVMLPLLFGMASPEETLQQIQERTDRYYTSPVRHLTNMEAAAQSWTDRRTQKIPYGRGFFYLAGLDARIRQVTDGRQSIDVVAFELNKLWLSGQAGTNEDFLRIAGDLAGCDLADGFRSMSAGEAFAPDPDSFGGYFECREVPAVEVDTNMEISSWQWSIRS